MPKILEAKPQASSPTIDVPVRKVTLTTRPPVREEVAAEVNARAQASVLVATASGNRRRPVYVPIKNEPGVLLMIPKNEMYIDHQYQRNINPRLVARIAANWSWVSCGALHVSQRNVRDRFFVFDGQHRFEAAKLIPSVLELPCIVFELEDIKDEALGFLAVNTERRIPNLADQFRALIMAGDHAAYLLRDLGLRWGRTIGAPSDATHISCVSDCLKSIRTDEAAFVRMFPVLSELCEEQAMTGRLVRGMSYLERYMPQGQSVADEKWRRRIIHVGYLTISQSIKETSAFEGQGNDNVCAQGILRAINKNLREKLEMRQPASNQPGSRARGML